MKRRSSPGKKAEKKVIAKKSSVQKKQSPKISTKKNERKRSKHPVDIKPFPIVGIGGSAGGLEAFSQLLSHLPADLGMAYVYVQHLSPNHESLLPEIVQRKTRMKVSKVVNNMPVEKDNVYVIPSKYNVIITDGKLKLENQNKEDSFHSIDHFLASLAPLYRHNAIGILLSGTG